MAVKISPLVEREEHGQRTIKVAEALGAAPSSGIRRLSRDRRHFVTPRQEPPPHRKDGFGVPRSVSKRRLGFAGGVPRFPECASKSSTDKHRIHSSSLASVGVKAK